MFGGTVHELGVCYGSDVKTILFNSAALGDLYNTKISSLVSTNMYPPYFYLPTLPSQLWYHYARNKEVVFGTTRPTECNFPACFLRPSLCSFFWQVACLACLDCLACAVLSYLSYLSLTHSNQKTPAKPLDILARETRCHFNWTFICSSICETPPAQISAPQRVIVRPNEGLSPSNLV